MIPPNPALVIEDGPNAGKYFSEQQLRSLLQPVEAANNLPQSDPLNLSAKLHEFLLAARLGSTFSTTDDERRVHGHYATLFAHALNENLATSEPTPNNGPSQISRYLNQALVHHAGIPISVTGVATTHADNWLLIDDYLSTGGTTDASST